jgi:pilus assembly protein Flp/PilA
MPMMYLIRDLVTLRFDRRAVTSVEYGMIAAVIIVGIVGSVLAVGNHLPSIFNKVSSEL